MVPMARHKTAVAGQLPADYPNLDLNSDFPLPSGPVLNYVGQGASADIPYNYVTPANDEEYRLTTGSPDAP